MSYEKTVWVNGDKVTSTKLNKIEDELETLDQRPSGGGSDTVFILIDNSGWDTSVVGWTAQNYESQAAVVAAAAAGGSLVYMKIGEYNSEAEDITSPTEIIPVVVKGAGETYSFEGPVVVTNANDGELGQWRVYLDTIQELVFAELITLYVAGDGGAAGGD